MSKLKLISLILLPWLGLGAADFALIKHGEPAAVIVKPDNQKAFKAVTDFNDGIRRCTGKPLPVSNEPDAGKNRIVLALEKLPVAESDRFSISFPDARTLKITATELSVRWAFNFILEEHFGCRFLFPVTRDLPYGEEINHYPSSRDVSVPRREVVKTASFNLARLVDYRARLWDWRWNIKDEGVIRSHMMTIDVFPVYKYAVDQSWPREMLPVLNGKKFIPPKAKAPLPKSEHRANKGYDSHWNPCFSHPKTAEIAIANILEILEKNPDRTSICLTINDNGGMCQCPECRKGVRGRNSVGHADYSPLYWTWVNKVADAVSRKYPNVYFIAAAYREVLDPPDFKLNDRVLPQLCFELTALNDPEAYGRRLKLLNRWKKTASQLALWDYSYGCSAYLFPRIYYRSHSRFLELFHQYNGRGIFVECSAKFPFEGPKYYLMAKKMMDIKADPEKIVNDWCVAAVGKKSAPYLRQYYQFWEDYWTGEAIRKTSWYPRRIGTYFPLGELPTHTLALKKGDMKKLRSLMEKVVTLAETPEQKKRAGILMQWFELSELAAQTLFSELVLPDRRLTGSADAVEMLRQIPGAVKAHEQLMKHPFIKYYSPRKNIAAAQLSLIGLVQPYIAEPQVKAAAMELAAAPETPLILRSLLKIWLGMKPANLLKNGSFEESAPLPRVLWSEGGGYRSAKMASDGDYSFRLPPKCTYAYRIPVQPGKIYLFMFDCYIKETSIEGLLNFQLSPYKGKFARRHYPYMNQRLPGGQWTTFTGICSAEQNADIIELAIWLRNFEKEDEIFLDNVRVYCLDDLKN